MACCQPRGSPRRGKLPAEVGGAPGRTRGRPAAGGSWGARRAGGRGRSPGGPRGGGQPAGGGNRRALPPRGGRGDGSVSWARRGRWPLQGLPAHHAPPPRSDARRRGRAVPRGEPARPTSALPTPGEPGNLGGCRLAGCGPAPRPGEAGGGTPPSGFAPRARMVRLSRELGGRVLRAAWCRRVLPGRSRGLDFPLPRSASRGGLEPRSHRESRSLPASSAANPASSMCSLWRVAGPPGAPQPGFFQGHEAGTATGSRATPA
jgi:hypothetical protein